MCRQGLGLCVVIGPSIVKLKDTVNNPRRLLHGLTFELLIYSRSILFWLYHLELFPITVVSVLAVII